MCQRYLSATQVGPSHVQPSVPHNLHPMSRLAATRKCRGSFRFRIQVQRYFFLNTYIRREMMALDAATTRLQLCGPVQTVVDRLFQNSRIPEAYRSLK